MPPDCCVALPRVPWVFLQFVMVFFPDHTHLLFLIFSWHSVTRSMIIRNTRFSLKNGETIIQIIELSAVTRYIINRSHFQLHVHRYRFEESAYLFKPVVGVIFCQWVTFKRQPTLIYFVFYLNNIYRG